MSSGRAFRWPVVVEPRPAAPLWLKVVLPIGSIALALVVVAAFLAFRSFNPLEVYVEIVKTAFGSWFGFADTLTSATPLILTGLAVAFAFRVRLWNIGAEGQLIFGGIAATGFGVWIGDIMAPQIGIPMTLIAGMFGGVFWVALVAYGKAKYGVNEILTSLMLNFVAVIFSYYLVDGSTSPWRDTTLIGHPVGREVASFLELPRLGTTRMHWGFFVAILAAAAVHYILRHTRLGFTMRVMNSSTKAARYSGISIGALTMRVLLISGSLAGLAGAIELLGRGGRFSPEGFAAGLGYTGIVVAALGRLTPLGIVVSAVILGAVENAALTLQSMANPIPISVSIIVQGTLILFVVGGATLLSYRWRWIPRRAGPDDARGAVEAAPGAETVAREESST